MNFQNTRAIFEQIADRICDEIIADVYPPDGRIPSVREYAILMQVNINTAVKAYELLGREEVVYNRRGMGYFVAPDAKRRILEQRRRAFLHDSLPQMFREMRLLGIGIDQVVTAWDKGEGTE